VIVALFCPIEKVRHPLPGLSLWMVSRSSADMDKLHDVEYPIASPETQIRKSVPLSTPLVAMSQKFICLD